MSTIVGYMDDGDVWVGADSATTTPEGERRLIVSKKLFRNGDYLIGCTGSARGGQLLSPELFEPPDDVVLMSEAIRIHFKESNFIALSQENQTEIHVCNFMIANKGKLYEILIDFQMNEIPKYSALGSGTQYALGVLYTLRNTNMKPEKKIMLALKAAAEFDTATGPPFKIEKL